MVASMLLLLAWIPTADDAVATELKKLAGAWEVIPAEGELNPARVTLEINGDRFTAIINEDNRVKLRATIHPNTKPVCIDLELEDKTVIEGIYRLEGDRLTFCIGQPNAKDRPTEIPEKSAPGMQVVRFKRARP